MRTLCSNQTGTLFGWLAGRFPGLFGNLFSTDGKFTPWKFAPYALDNGAFPAWTKNRPWDESAWLRLMDRAAVAPIQPDWVLVPDVVADKYRTLEAWHKYLPLIQQRGFVPAFAVQDGMTIEDVPAEAQVVFVGGTTDWKWASVEMWCQSFTRVHVGRVNWISQLRVCYAAGAESTDGTGWFRGSVNQFNGLVQFYEEITSPRGQEFNLSELRRTAGQGSYFKYRDEESRNGTVKQMRMF